MSASDSHLQRKLQALRDSYSARLPGELEEIERVWRVLADGDWDPANADLLYRLAHGLAGAAGIFGYPQLSRHAVSLEQLLHRHLNEEAAPDAGQRAAMERLLLQLREAAGGADTAAQPASGTENDAHRPADDPHHPLVYLLEDDAGVAEELALQLAHFGYRVEAFHDSAGLRDAVARRHPAAFIVDIILPEGRNAGLELMSELRHREAPEQPVIFISSRDDFEARLAAVRAGGDDYFVKPVEIAALIDSLDRLTQSVESEPWRILIVDDDATLAAQYAAILENAGMQVETVTRASAILKVLSEFHAELILMDVQMPECSGLELARVVRQQDGCEGIPIVFLSAETSTETRRKALHLGGDAFLTKPIDDDQLAAAITVRAERARFLNTLMLKDSLTGLLNHTRIKEQLAVEVSRARRAGGPLTFAMIDIDHFKNVNDRFGHMMGDHVIKTLARLFQQRLRRSDSIGRYGGEEFAVILPDCDLQLAGAILEEIRALFSAIRFAHKGEGFSVTFSAGLATWPEYDNPGDLNRAADEALYEAKRLGRDRIAVAGAQP